MPRLILSFPIPNAADQFSFSVTQPSPGASFAAQKIVKFCAVNLLVSRSLDPVSQSSSHSAQVRTGCSSGTSRAACRTPQTSLQVVSSHRPPD